MAAFPVAGEPTIKWQEARNAKQITSNKYHIALWLRTLGSIHLINFASLLHQSQVLLLIGENSIAPMTINLQRTRELMGQSRWLYLHHPSMYWFDSSDNFILLTCTLALLASCHLTVGSPFFNSRYNLILLYITLLSLCSSGGELFSFPWDHLLLEATCLSFVLPRLDPQSSLNNEPDLFGVWGIRWLSFRFMFSMGVEKLPFINHNKHWLEWTYLTRFYETEQPMPTFLAYYAHHMPVYIHQICCLLTWLVEVLVPLFILCSSCRLCKSCHQCYQWRTTFKYATACIMSAIQIPIFLTGNYSILNVLSIGLTLPLLSSSSNANESDVTEEQQEQQEQQEQERKEVDSIDKPWVLLEKEQLLQPPPQQRLPWPLRYLLVLHAMSGGLLFLRTVEALDYLGNTNWIYSSVKYEQSILSSIPLLQHVFKWTSTYRVSNQYGGVFHDSFRHEGKIVPVIEGSNDNVHWESVEFKYHISNVKRVPPLFHPYFPRLDHYMFYVANDISFNDMNPLSPFCNGGMGDHFLLSFVQQLLENSRNSSTWLLMRDEKNTTTPSSKPPYKYIRANRSLYRFSNLSSTTWWDIHATEEWLPSVCLDLQECGSSNVVAICQLLNHGNSNRCKEFQRLTGFQIDTLHNSQDPSRLLFQNDEYLFHWLFTVPLSYLERLKELYDLGSTTRAEQPQYPYRFSDVRLIEWALQVREQCNDKNLDLTGDAHGEICVKLR